MPLAQALASMNTFLLSKTQWLMWTGHWEVVSAQCRAGLRGPLALTGGWTLNPGHPAQKWTERPDQAREGEGVLV